MRSRQKSKMNTAYLSCSFQVLIVQNKQILDFIWLGRACVCLCNKSCSFKTVLYSWECRLRALLFRIVKSFQMHLSFLKRGRSSVVFFQSADLQCAAARCTALLSSPFGSSFFCILLKIYFRLKWKKKFLLLKLLFCYENVMSERQY